MMNRARLLSRLAMVFLGVGALSAIAWKGVLGPSRPAIEDGDFGAVGDFHLTERSGRAVSLEDLKGKVWVADFVFTRCMGPCPRLTRAMAKLQAAFSQAPDARFVSFSVDPEHDTPAVLREYADKFGADPERWLFLTGNTPAVHDVVQKSFKLAVQENPGAPAGEAVVHSLHFVVVDKDGRVRGYFTATDDASLGRLKKRVESLL